MSKLSHPNDLDEPCKPKDTRVTFVQRIFASRLLRSILQDLRETRAQRDIDSVRNTGILFLIQRTRVRLRLNNSGASNRTKSTKEQQVYL